MTTPPDTVVAGLNIAPHFPPQGKDILVQMGPVAPGDSVTLNIGASLYSPSRAFRLRMQIDGNAVLQYADTPSLPPGWPNKPLDPDDGGVTWITFWATKTPEGTDHLAMQGDGNLVAQHEDNTRVGPFSGGGFPQGDNTRTGGNPGAFFRLQDDGNLVIRSQSGAVLWQSSTSVAESSGANFH